MLAIHVSPEGLKKDRLNSIEHLPVLSENYVSVFAFDSALVRDPAPNVVVGLRANGGPDPDYETLRAEHRAYVAALEAAGVAVDTLPPLDAFPDSIFVEDPAFVLPEGAILLRPGAPSRIGEVQELGSRPSALGPRPSALGQTEDGVVIGANPMTTPVLFSAVSREPSVESFYPSFTCSRCATCSRCSRWCRISLP